MVEELADLLGGLVVRLVLGGHPHLGGLLDDLLPDRVHAGVELRDGARTLGSGLRLLGQLGIQLLKALHGAPAYGPRPARLDGAHRRPTTGTRPVHDRLTNARDRLTTERRRAARRRSRRQPSRPRAPCPRPSPAARRGRAPAPRRRTSA